MENNYEDIPKNYCRYWIFDKQSAVCIPLVDKTSFPLDMDGEHHSYLTPDKTPRPDSISLLGSLQRA